MEQNSFVSIAPAPHVRAYVENYWFCNVVQLARFLNCPLPRPLLAIRLRGNILLDDKPLKEEITLAGVCTFAAQADCIDEYYALLVPLTIAGTLRLFPALGEASNGTFELGDVLGDKLSRDLYGTVVSAWEPQRIALAVDDWLTERLQRVKEPRESRRFLEAYEQLSRGQDLATAANRVEVSSRQLERWFDVHLGIGPKRLMRLERLHRSLQAMRTGGDPLLGYCDQSHQIRDFQTYLRITPGQYKREFAQMSATHGKISARLVRESITLSIAEI